MNISWKFMHMNVYSSFIHNCQNVRSNQDVLPQACANKLYHVHTRNSFQCFNKETNELSIYEKWRKHRCSSLNQRYQSKKKQKERKRRNPSSLLSFSIMERAKHRVTKKNPQLAGIQGGEKDRWTAHRFLGKGQLFCMGLSWWIQVSTHFFKSYRAQAWALM